jgi:chromosome segregation ATPase
MNKIPAKKLLAILLASALVFGVIRYVLYLRDNIDSLENQKQNLMLELEKEKNEVQKLQAKNSNLKSNLKATHKRLNKAFSGLSLSEKRAKALESQADILKVENSALLEENKKLVNENDTLKSKLTSIPELKEAIQELKRISRASGNRGFLIKNGHSASTSKIKIEVVPAPQG